MALAVLPRPPPKMSFARFPSGIPCDLSQSFWRSGPEASVNLAVGQHFGLDGKLTTVLDVATLPDTISVFGTLMPAVVAVRQNRLAARVLSWNCAVVESERMG